MTILPVGVGEAGSALLEPDLLAAAAVVALASSVIPYSLDLEALRLVPARVFGVLMSLEPAVAALAGLVVLGQQLVAREWLAIALVVVATAGATAPGEVAGCCSRGRGRAASRPRPGPPRSPPRSAAAHAAPRAAGGG